MRAFTQTVVLLVVVVGLVFLLAFVTQFNTAEPFADKTTVNGTSLPKRDETAQSVDWLMTKNLTTAISEVGQNSHYDFWFQNPHDVPVQVGLETVSCNCSSIFIGVVGPEGFKSTAEGKQFVERFLVPGTALLATAGFLPDLPWLACLNPHALAYGAAFTAKADELIDKQITWQEQTLPAKGRNPNGTTVPPRGIGKIRVRWKGKEQSTEPIRLKVELWCRSQAGKLVVAPPLEVSALVLGPLLVYPPLVQLPTPIPLGGKQDAHFLCMSYTRKEFALQAREANGDPCFACTITPLTAEERRTAQDNAQVPVSGYRVTVTIRERVDAKTQLDLGHFSRRIILSSPAGDDLVVRVMGEVKGGVEVATPDGLNRVAFKNFAVSRGASETVTLSSDQADLEFDDRPEVVPEALNRILKTELKRDPGVKNGSRWKLLVQVPPNKANGPLPENGAVILKTRGEAARKVRIPISGDAFVLRGGS